MRVDSPQDQLLAKLAALRVELVDLAYQLDVQGRLEAADVAMSTSARVAEICEEFTDGKSKDADRKVGATAAASGRETSV